MALKVMQIILNNGWASYNLLMQQATEEKAGICLISEPPRTPDTSYRINSIDGRAAIMWRSKELSPGVQCTLVKKGQSCVVVEIDNTWMVSCYISPNSTREEYTDALEELGEVICTRGSTRIIIGGNLNARSSAWDPYGTNSRGPLVEAWAAELDMRLINEGVEPTLVNPRGRSIVDLTWASPDITGHSSAGLSEHETLSDHKYVVYKVRLKKWKPTADATSKSKAYHPRWNFAKMDDEVFRLALDWSSEDCPARGDPAKLQARWLDRKLNEACNLAVPKTGPGKARRQVHGWSGNINKLRNNCNRQRRALTRFNRNHSSRVNLTTRTAHHGWQHSSSHDFLESYQQEDRAADRERKALLSVYKAAKKEFYQTINKAKLNAWSKLIKTIEIDPWGLPYKMVLKRLKGSTTALTETMPPKVLDSVLDSLFPRTGHVRSLKCQEEEECWTEDLHITPQETLLAIKGRSAKNTAPGRD